MLFLLPLFLFVRKEKSGAKRKANWDNKYRDESHISRMKVLLDTFSFKKRCELK